MGVDRGQFIQNWKVPRDRDVCYRVELTLNDGSALAAFFQTR